MRINIETSEIQAFVAVARQSSFKAAAEGLFISQPALSRRIENLEHALQERLFNRTTRRVSLTRAGEIFLTHALAVLEELDIAMKNVEQGTVHRREHVTVACIPSVATRVLPRVLRKFSLQHPNVRVKVIDESAIDVLESVRKGESDFGINFIGAQEADIEFEEIANEHYLAVMPADHPLAHLGSVSCEALCGERLVSVSSSSGNRGVIDRAFARIQERPVIQYEINHVSGAISLVAAGVGIALLPELAITGAPYTGIVSKRLTRPVITRPLGLITRKGDVLRPAAELMTKEMRAAILASTSRTTRSSNKIQVIQKDDG
ncbi:LysR family transcriptional regulator [Herbaspirillum sp. SJZ099]|uniref:LysR family transcriptional regulator n=1 Tax=Herbaspirillum sp. SJZ099 TaxID=2572916 RepID=UPI0011A721E8|nr:LysR family transcriptional regulator [Herbaspirillum sp. SJZ099]TWC69600.1 DNA-binding transcriptional LysR family regulator [Herbaspirillum sp. SJZ099]